MHPHNYYIPRDGRWAIRKKIEYTPDELSEIDRILDILPDESAALKTGAAHSGGRGRAVG